MGTAAWLSLLVILVGILSTEASSHFDEYPGGMTRKEFIDTWGLGKELYEEMKKPTIQFKEKLAKQTGRDFDPKSKGAALPVYSGFLLTPSILEEFEEEKKGRRRKRSYFSTIETKWETTDIRYKLDGFSGKGKDMIEDAIKEFEDKTCFDFDEEDDDHQILFINTGENSEIPCSSDIGMRRGPPNIIFLREPDCIAEVGIVLRHIAQTLGFWPEPFRQDREKYVSATDLNFVFGRPSDVYDFNSVLHYASDSIDDPTAEATEGRVFTISPILKKVFPHTDIWRQGMGQLQELSFYDAKGINAEYCHCAGTFYKCENNGYIFKDRKAFPDLEDCDDNDQCVCPNGFAGKKCDKIDKDVHSSCSTPQEIELDPGSYEEKCITTPGYGNGGYEGDKQVQCNWKFHSKNCHIYFYFVGEFDLYCRNSFVCDHWVEIGGFNESATDPGPRFCCNKRPEVFMNGPRDGEGTFRDTLLVTFRTPKEVDKKFGGFKLCASSSC